MTTSKITPQETSPFVKPLQTLVRFFDDPSNSRIDSNDEDTLTVDESLDLLSSSRRRAVIEQLAASEQDHVRVADLAERVAGTEYGCEPSEISSDERKRVYISLIQSHLPRLANAGVVSYAEDTKIVSPGPQYGNIYQAHIALQETLS
ncbi:DUF7344 domain-containing protein [Natronobacterium texcoconense]|uniref:DUF7344 domain-containing protein n=1 Tax=Natronobacterium texcoconense TaxID=1095778 RepID=UPI000B8125E2|nr:hypothetical protein [Natronobacterium texcoconense]